MKREGRMPGTNVRLSRRVRGSDGRVPNKPTNQSRSAAKLPLASMDSKITNILVIEHELPSSKSMGKTKSAFKAKDLDITRNHLMQDWKIYELGNQLAHGDESRELEESEGTVLMPEADHLDDDDREMLESEPWSSRPSSSEMVLPLESLLSKRKSTAKTISELPSSPQSVSRGLDEDNDGGWFGLDFFTGENAMSIDDWLLITAAD